MNRQIDEWKKEREKQMSMENKEERLQNEIIAKELKLKELSKKKYELQKLLCSVNELYNKRLAKLSKQGYKPKYRPSAIEEGLLQTANNEVLQYKEVVVSEKRKKEWYCYKILFMIRIHKQETKEETDEEYYNGAQQNLSKLIAIR